MQVSLIYENAVDIYPVESEIAGYLFSDCKTKRKMFEVVGISLLSPVYNMKALTYSTKQMGNNIKSTKEARRKKRNIFYIDS